VEGEPGVEPVGRVHLVAVEDDRHGRRLERQRMRERFSLTPANDITFFRPIFGQPPTSRSWTTSRYLFFMRLACVKMSDV
jgi:hypothetical protein